MDWTVDKGCEVRRALCGKAVCVPALRWELDGYWIYCHPNTAVLLFTMIKVTI